MGNNSGRRQSNALLNLLPRVAGASFGLATLTKLNVSETKTE